MASQTYRVPLDLLASERQFYADLRKRIRERPDIDTVEALQDGYTAYRNFRAIFPPQDRMDVDGMPLLAWGLIKRSLPSASRESVAAGSWNEPEIHTLLDMIHNASPKNEEREKRYETAVKPAVISLARSARAIEVERADSPLLEKTFNLDAYETSAIQAVAFMESDPIRLKARELKQTRQEISEIYARLAKQTQPLLDTFIYNPPRSVDEVRGAAEEAIDARNPEVLNQVFMEGLSHVNGHPPRSTMASSYMIEAIKADDPAVMQVFFDHGKSAQTVPLELGKASRELTPLLMAAFAGSYRVIPTILANGGEANMTAPNQATNLLPLGQMLDRPPDHRNLASFVCRDDWDTAARALLDHGARPVVGRGFSEGLSELKQNGCDPAWIEAVQREAELTRGERLNTQEVNENDIVSRRVTPNPGLF